MSSSDVGYGQQTPWDTADEFSVIAFVVRQMMARMSTMKLVRVEKVNPAEGDGDIKPAGTVDVLPLVNQIDGNGNATPHGTVYRIPWYRMQSGAWAIVCDPKVGDIGYVVCADRDSSAVVSSRKQANPGSRRKFDLSDGIYMGGVLNDAPTSYLHLKSDGTFKLADANGNVLESSEDGFTLTGNLAVEGNLTATGEITARQGGASVGLATHVHTSAAAGNPTSGPTPGT